MPVSRLFNWPFAGHLSHQAGSKSRQSLSGSIGDGKGKAGASHAEYEFGMAAINWVAGAAYLAAKLCNRSAGSGARGMSSRAGTRRHGFRARPCRHLGRSSRRVRRSCGWGSRQALPWANHRRPCADQGGKRHKLGHAAKPLGHRAWVGYCSAAQLPAGRLNTIARSASPGSSCFLNAQVCYPKGEQI